MPSFDWEKSKFVGIHTQPSKVEAGEIFAANMQNLRIDSDGWLQLRESIIASLPDGENITGVASTQDHLWVLRDGKLYVREVADFSIETEISGVTGMNGRLSVVSFRTYVIIISEGSDQGYMIDLREDKNYNAVGLGLTPPATGSSMVVSIVNEVPDGAEKGGAGKLSKGQYIYSYAYMIYDDDDDALLWNGMQSNIWLGSDRVVGDETYYELAGDTVGPDENTNYARVRVSYVSGLTATHIRIYRAHIDDQYNLKQVADFPVNAAGGTITFYDGYADADLEETSKERRISDQNIIVNRRTEKFNKIPEEVKTIFEYNNLIFAPAGDRLIYSEISFGNLVPWSYPEENDIRVPGKVEFCAELHGILIFGAIDGLHRVTGVTEHDFRVDTIGSVGPVDAWAWDKTLDTLAFVGEGGLYATDASAAIRLSDIVLDDFFKNKTVRRGGVIFFKDNDILFSVNDEQFKFEDKYWTRWTFPFQQSTSITQNKNTNVFVADNTGRLKKIDWNNTISTQDLNWMWASNWLDGTENNAKLEKMRKRFSEFTFTGSAEGEITLKTWVNNDTGEPTTYTFEARPESLLPVRVPINRIGRRLKFEISGIGSCKIQGIGLKIVA